MYKNHIHVYQLASTNGDGTGDTQATGDYSSSETIFYIQPPIDEHFCITRVIVGLEDAGSFDSGSYGNGLALTNGVVTRISDNTGVRNTLSAGPVLTNGDWAMQCHDFTLHNFGQGNEVASIRWTFAKGKEVYLSGPEGQKLEIVLNDDFSGLVKHQFFFQGYKVDEFYY